LHVGAVSDGDVECRGVHDRNVQRRGVDAWRIDANVAAVARRDRVVRCVGMRRVGRLSGASARNEHEPGGSE
jgi:hypothetical protein